MKGNQNFLLSLTLFVVASNVCLAERAINPCQYFANNTNIRDPDDCSVGLTCIDFQPIETTICSGSSPFYDKDKNACAKTLTDETTCEIICTDSAGKFVADPKSCYGYYYCEEEDWARHGVCPEGTHFDVAVQMCIRSVASNCTSQDINFCAIVKDSVSFNDPSSCEKYFTCKKGNLTSTSCKNLYYDAVLGSCVQKSLVDCEVHPYPSNVCGTVKKPKADVLVADGATCRGAFYCAVTKDGEPDPTPMWTQCPENKFFSEAKQSCVDPLEAACDWDRCEGRSLPFVSSGTAGCRSYLRCVNGIQVEELSCGNKFFDEEAQVCSTAIIQYPSCS